jgi:hypothetical protein
MKTLSASMIGALTSVLLLSGCKIAGLGNDDEAPPTAATVMNIFTYTRFATEVSCDAELGCVLSYLWGKTAVATNPNPTFHALSTPAMGSCFYTREEGINADLQRNLDVGSLTITGQGTSHEAQKHASQLYFYAPVLLEAGDYEINTSGFQGALAYQQRFAVSEHHARIYLRSGANGQRLEADETNAVLEVKRGENLAVELENMPTADFYKITVTDNNSGDMRASVSCYQSLDTPAITIPKEAFAFFRNTQDGTVMVDFINSSLTKDLPGIRESLVLSTTRHVHGMWQHQTNEGSFTLRFGQLHFVD